MPIASFTLQVEDCQYSGCHVKRSRIFDFLSLVHPVTRSSGKDVAADARATHCRAAAVQGLCKVWPTFMTAFECCKTCPLRSSLHGNSHQGQSVRRYIQSLQPLDASATTTIGNNHNWKVCQGLMQEERALVRVDHDQKRYEKV